MTTTTFKFCVTYPSKESSRTCSNTKWGIFENLQKYVRTGFNGCQKDAIRFLSSGSKDGGIFIFDYLDKENIDNVSLNGTKNEKKKKKSRWYINFWS